MSWNIWEDATWVMSDEWWEVRSGWQTGIYTFVGETLTSLGTLGRFCLEFRERQVLTSLLWRAGMMNDEILIGWVIWSARFYSMNWLVKYRPIINSHISIIFFETRTLKLQLMVACSSPEQESLNDLPSIRQRAKGGIDPFFLMLLSYI